MVDSHDPPDDEVPEWLVDLAWKVRELLHLSDVEPRFREAVEAWTEDYQIRQKKTQEWDRRRHAHHSLVCRHERLRDRDAGPPKDDWIWEDYPLEIEKPLQGALGFEPGSVEGWTPPDLFLFAGPRTEMPLPLQRGRSLTEDEKCAVLGAIHDYVLKGTEPTALTYRSLCGGSIRSGTSFGHLVKLVPALNKSDLRIVQEYLTDIRKHFDTENQRAGLNGEDSGGSDPAQADNEASPDIPRDPDEWPPKDGWHLRPGEAALDGCSFELTGKKWKLLESFVNASRRLTMSDLAGLVWIEYPVGDKAIQSTISILRKVLKRELKLSDDFDPIPSKDSGAQISYQLNPALRIKE